MAPLALIITGGPIFPGGLAEIPEHGICVAADCGFDSAVRLGIVPDCIIGDFDSIGNEIFDGIIGAGGKSPEVVRYPSRKNETDTMLAVNFAAERGYREFYIVGGLGGRADHTLSNILFLEQLAVRGLRAVYTDGANEIRILRGGERAEIPHGDYKYFSVIALERSEVTLTGCEYPLDHALLERHVPYAVSNETLPGGAAAECISGTLILVRSERV